MSLKRVALASSLLLPSLTTAGAAEPPWSGPYIGAFAGYVDANRAWDVGPADPEISPEGLTVGGFAGYTHEVDGLVLGAELDISGADFSDSGGCDAATFTCSLDVQVLSSLRARAGIAVGQIQFYGAAGLALGFIQAESDVNGGSSDSKALAGWTVGGGAEWMAEGGLRLGVEYRHSDYGDADVNFGGLAQGDVRLETNEVRLRLSIPLD